MDRSSVDLRNALRAAEAAIRVAISCVDPSNTEDAAGIEDLRWAAHVVAARLRQLEEGRWPGRTVEPYVAMPKPPIKVT